MDLSRTLTLAILLLATELATVQVVRERDIINLRPEGVALTIGVFKPKHPNGAAIVKIGSGG